MADDIVVDIKFRGNATEFLAELSRAVGRAKTQLQEMGQSTAALSRLETQLAKMSTTANQAASAATRAASATRGWAQTWTPFKGQFQQAEASSKALWSSIDSGLKQADASYVRGRQAIADYKTAQAGLALKQARQTAVDDWDKQFRDLTHSVNQAKGAIDQYQNSLSNTRYVLYDVAGTLSVLGIAFVAPLAAVVNTAVQMELAFSQVARTSGLTGAALGELKEDFDSLYGSIPITYEALAQIATLAGQLGVPASDIANFTETVAKTATVTNLSVEQAATAFGRLNALIPNVQGQYDRLGSAIAKVGVNSVATESEIVNISTQISSMGAFAGLTAQDIIGLSGALASIGAQPELSRGTVTRVFTLMSRAVAAGGEDLEKFAKISGVSAEQFGSTWGTSAFTETFLGFMAGIKNQGGGAVAALNDLGVTSVRDVPLLLRLANAADTTGKAGALLAQTIGDSNSGWADNIELQRQYEIVAATVAKRFEVLTNNFQLLLQAIGAPLLGGLGEFLSFLTDITREVTNFAKTDLGGNILTVATALSALLGVLVAGAAGMALMGASSIGVYQALRFLAIQSPLTASALLGTSGAAAVASGTLKAGAASALLFSRALKTITILGALTLLPSLFEEIHNWMDKVNGVARSSKTALPLFTEALKGLGDTPAVANATDKIEKLRVSLLLLSTGENGRRAIGGIKDEINELAKAGDKQGLRNLIDDLANLTGLSGKELVKIFPGMQSALDSLGTTYAGLKGSTEAASGAVDGLGGSLSAIDAEAQAATEALQGYRDELEKINGTQISASEASDRLQSSINSAWEAMKAGEVTLDGVNDNSIAFRDSLRGIEEDARLAADAILQNGGSTEEATGKWQAGRNEIIAMLTQMGLAPDAAAAWADAQYGSAEEIARGLALIKAGVDAIPTSKTITLVADTAPAMTAINSFIFANNGRRINLYVDSYSGRSVNGATDTVARAGGGSVRGPGTSTSDSIHALLSDGEYVLRTRAAAAIGYGKLDYMNRTGKLPAFATGGAVNVTTPAPGPTELSATDRRLLAARGSAGELHATISIADIARKVNRYNASEARRGK